LSDTVLLLVLQRMGDKESPFTYVETHAGAGSYGLLEGAATKLNEQADGIELLLNSADRAGGLDALPAHAQTLVEMSRDRTYPGSPKIAAEQLRPQDSLLLCELAPEPHAQLCGCAPIDALIAEGRARVLCADGYKAVRLRESDGDAASPPQKRPRKQPKPQARPRALVLIDPPYQMGGDTERIVQQRVPRAPSWRCRSSHCPGLVRLTLPAPGCAPTGCTPTGCASHSGCAAAPLRPQWWEVAAGPRGSAEVLR
jgi:23S rRNA (adenine2030-N6)-methyltransferase